MQRAVLRLLASVILMAQIVPVPAGWLCTRAHRQHASCEQAQPTAAPAVNASQGAAVQPCLLGPCVAPMPAVASAIVVATFVSADVRESAPAFPAAPASFTSAPIPPPPQA